MKTLSLLFIVLAVQINAQQNTWKHYYKGEIINDILETNNALLIGTNVGLVKIDKLTDSIEVSNVFNSTLNNNYIRSIISDHNGVIWIKTNVGVSFFEGNTWTHFTPDNSILEHDDPTESYYGATDQLFVDGANRIWTKNNDRLLYYKDGNWTFTYEATSLIYFKVNKNGNAWLLYYSTSGVAEKLKRFDGYNWIVEDNNLPDSVFVTNIKMMDFDAENNFWFYTNGSSAGPPPGMLKWNTVNENWSFFERDSSIINPLRSLTIDSANNLWCFNAYQNDLVKFTAPSTWASIPLPDSLENSLVHELVATSEGIAFLLTDDWGNDIHNLGFLDTLNQLQIFDTPFENKTRKQKLKYLSDGGIFMGGILEQPSIFKNNAYKIYDISNAPIYSDFIYEILGEDSLGSKYFNLSSAQSIPYFLKNNKYQTFDTENWNTINYFNESTDGISKLNEKGEIYFKSTEITSDPIYVYKNENWEIIDTANQVYYQNGIEEMEIDKNGTLWFTPDEEFHSLFKYENENWQEYNFDSLNLPDQSFQIWGFDNQNQIWMDIRYGYEPYVLHEQSDTFQLTLNPTDMFPIFFYPSYGKVTIKEQNNGNIFFMRAERLIKFDGNQLSYYDHMNSPLPEEIVFNDIQLDSLDNIWLATSNGLYKFDGENDWENFTPYNSPLADIIVKSVFIDKENTVWVTDAQSGIYCFKEEQTVKVENIQLENNKPKIQLFPNPFYKQFTLALDVLKSEDVYIEIMNMEGTIIHKKNMRNLNAGQHQIPITLSNQLGGIYFCKITSGNEVVVLNLVKM